MSPDELEQALEELELRLERLRALYEQYFLGFEKIEPAVARKDVDRRIYLMRREKIRNTGKRFKLQTLIQRYNTFQQYWQRICREIENGTYKRHLLRAERQLSPEQQLTIAARRRFGKTRSVPPPAEVFAAAAAESRTSRPAPPLPGEPVAPMAMAAAPMASPIAASSLPPAIREKQQAPSPTRPPKYESLELDMGFLGSWVPPAPKPSPQAGVRPPDVAVPAEQPKPRDGAAKPKSSPKAAPPPAGRPAGLRAQPPPKPARPGAARDAAGAGGGSMSDDRVREIQARLNQLKKDNREAGQVSFESLAKTIRATETQLRSQYKNRKIDFEVVVKDGKAIVKPKVR